MYNDTRLDLADMSGQVRLPFGVFKRQEEEQNRSTEQNRVERRRGTEREDHNFNFKGKVMDSSSPATPLHPIISPTPNPSETERRIQPESTCFRCKNQGHWARDCPYKKITTPSSSSSLPEILCANGHGPCTAKVSRSPRNPGRIYYACPLQDLNGSKCGFFKWYDQLAPGHHLSLSLSQSDYPICSCGAGRCKLMLETSQPNAGRLYFICPITKGHGACPFFLWYDSEENTSLSAQVDESSLDGSPNSSLNDHLAIQTINYDLDEKDGLSVEHQNMIMFESAEIDNHQLSLSINSVPLDPLENEEEALTWIEEHDDTSNMDTSTDFSNLSIVLRDHHHDLVVQEGGLLNPIMEKIPQVCKQSLPAKIHCQQIEFWRENSAAGDTLNGDDVHQILGFHIFGWLGRLAFPPSECLTVPSSKPLFCCVFPPLVSILVPKEKYESHSEVLIDLPHSLSNSGFLSSPQVPSEDEAQPLSGVLFELSGLDNLLGPSQDSVVTGTIVEALEQAALPIQNLLVTLLESINPLEHESMTWAADCTFASLDHLSVDYTHFSERVMKYISSASSFAEIERSIQNDVSSDEELMEQYHNEIDRFDTISCTHADNVEAFTTSDHRLQSLRKEASRIKEMLLQIENQISFCEAEMSELNTRVGDSSKDLIESEKMLHAAAEKAEAAMEQCHQREVIRSAAKAALEEARAQLLQ